MTTLQASLEFILILAGVSTLALASVIGYSHLQSSAKSILSDLNNSPVGFSVNNTLPDFHSTPTLNIYFPLNSSFGVPNKMQIDAYGCDSGLLRFALSSNNILFSRPYGSAAIAGIVSINDSFVPFASGEDAVLLNYTLNCTGGEFVSANEELFTYAATFTTPYSSQQNAYATISQRNESIYYPLQNQGFIVNFTQFNHCTYVNFWDVPYSPTVQCGYNPAAYDYYTFDGGCLAPNYPYLRTYCIVPNEMSYAAYALNTSAPHLRYSFELEIQTPEGTVAASLTNATNSSQLYLGGQVIGTAIISQAYSPPYSQLFTMIADGNDTYLYANATLYAQYLQYKNALYAQLNYYDNQGSAGEIPQSLATYEQSLSTMLRSLQPTTTGGCEAGGSYLICEPFTPFTYQIVINASGIYSQSLYYDGSLIRINGG